MLDFSSMKSELRYGTPTADQILINHFYTVGYSYYFRQARWALEIVRPERALLTKTARLNDFRPDLRVPKQFRADLSDYSESGYDRGHLVSSADQESAELQNSETFLLSNMSPQKPEFNRRKWEDLERSVRKLNEQKGILQTFAIAGPIFNFEDATKMIGKDDENGISIPVPSHFFKCVLTEDNRGALKMWAFEMENTELKESLDKYQVTTAYIEKKVGICIWGNLTGKEIEIEKNQIRDLWEIPQK